MNRSPPFFINSVYYIRRLINTQQYFHHLILRKKKITVQKRKTKLFRVEEKLGKSRGPRGDHMRRRRGGGCGHRRSARREILRAAVLRGI